MGLRPWAQLATAVVMGVVFLGTPAQAASAPEFPADIAVTGGSAHGKLGAEVSIPITRINNGPSDPVQGNITFELKVPGAVELLGNGPTSPACTIVVPKRHYRCLNTNFMMVGHLYKESVLVKIVSTSPAPGFVSVSYKDDPKTSNNRASLTVAVDSKPKPKPTTAPATTKAAPKPTTAKPTPTRTATASATASPSPTASPSADVVVAIEPSPAAASPADDGSPMWPWLLGGVLAVVAGAVTLLRVRAGKVGA